MMVHFDDLFVVSAGNVLQPRVVMSLNGQVFSPDDFPPLEEMLFGGMPLPQLANKLFNVDISYVEFAVFTLKSIVDDIRT